MRSHAEELHAEISNVDANVKDTTDSKYLQIINTFIDLLSLVAATVTQVF